MSILPPCLGYFWHFNAKTPRAYSLITKYLGDFNHNISFYFIFFFDIIEILKYKTTLVACIDFFDIVFEIVFREASSPS